MKINNALLAYMKNIERGKKIEVGTFNALLEDYFYDNPHPLFDPDQKNYTRNEDAYLTIKELYESYMELKNTTIELPGYTGTVQELPGYTEERMLAIIENNLAGRYKKFKAEYDRRYREQPKKTIDEYLGYFEEQMLKLADKLEFKWYPNGFTSEDKKIVKKSLEETILYLRSIGKWKLADDVAKHNTESLPKPKLPKKTLSEMVESHSKIMAIRCNISKTKATKLLQNTISKLF